MFTLIRAWTVRLLSDVGIPRPWLNTSSPTPPFRNEERAFLMSKKKYTFIDLFAGIGGFHTAMHSVGGRCVFASEWDKYARQSYEENYKWIEPNLFKKDKEGNYLYFNEDINDVDPSKVPDFDICCGGFPCQPFSVAFFLPCSESWTSVQPTKRFN